MEGVYRASQVASRKKKVLLLISLPQYFFIVKFGLHAPLMVKNCTPLSTPYTPNGERLGVWGDVKRSVCKANIGDGASTEVTFLYQKFQSHIHTSCIPFAPQKLKEGITSKVKNI